jgi:FAD/FMN-containing dehydrogenase
VGFDLSFRRSALQSFRRVAIAQLATTYPEYEVCDFGHIADGGMHFNLVQRTSTTVDSSRINALRDHVLDLAVRDFGASFSGEHGIGRANQAAYDHYIPASIQRYSAAITALFARLPAAAVRFGPPLS